MAQLDLFVLLMVQKSSYTPGSSNIAVPGKWGENRIEDVGIRIENGDIPASYVS